MHRAGFLILALALTVNVFGQSLKSPAYTEIGFLTGKIVKNYPAFPGRDLAFFSSLRIGNKLNGTKYWHRYYFFPDASFKLLFGSLGNKKVLGNISGLLYELSFEQKLTDKLYLLESPSLGIAYFNNPYHEINNPLNIAVGSKLTFLAAASFQLRYYFSYRWSGNIEATVLHASNSHFKLPNVGINLPAIGVGVRYHINPLIMKFTGQDSLPFYKGIRPSVRISIGHNEQGGSTGPVNGPTYPIYLVALTANKLLTPVNKIHAGFEAYYNTGVNDYILSQQFYEEEKFTNSTAFLFITGHEFLLGHFSLFTNGGVYIHNPFYRELNRRENFTDVKSKLKTLFTARIGIQYYLKDAVFKPKNQLYAGVYIKTNLGQADFLETGIGYTF
ncbi:MAG TPA: acyloxyacyl hydrolase [Bacteroidia bacterium]|nr:acyloxyacyl hydrolase [Bacteroidia bacterium]HNU32891.1 acyloxyacyl hydrolase [Bacteroidia bacterium]